MNSALLVPTYSNSSALKELISVSRKKSGCRSTTRVRILACKAVYEGVPIHHVAGLLQVHSITIKRWLKENKNVQILNIKEIGTAISESENNEATDIKIELGQWSLHLSPRKR